MRKELLLRIAFPLFLAAALAMVAFPSGCGGGGGKPALILAATDDLEGSGLLESWTRGFQMRSGRLVEVVTDTDDRVCDMARHGECDLIITHVPSDEERLERAGYVTDRQEIMRDSFVLVGPLGDPAGAGGAEKIEDALKGIAEARLPFLLRVDGSGVAIKARSLWSLTGIEETGDWLIESPEGAEGALRRASIEGAYTLTGKSLYDRLAEELNLELIMEGGEALVDHYHAMVISTLTYPDTDVAGAREFISGITGSSP